MTGVEIDFVVPSSIQALELYERVFEVVRVEVTDMGVGASEAVFAIFGVRFHILDENPDYMLFAPKPGDPKTMWLNISVEDINVTYAKALEAGCIEIQPIVELESMGTSNAMFSDPFGYIWMLQQVHREVSYEDRLKAAKAMMGEGGE